MLDAYNCLALALVERGDNYGEACDFLHVAHEHLSQTDSPQDHFWDWLMTVALLCSHWGPGDHMPELLGLCEKALDPLAGRGQLPVGAEREDLAAVAEMAGRLLVRQGETTHAEHHLRRALQLDYDRVTAAREISFIYVDQERWADALMEQQRVASLEPSDRGARAFADALRVVVEGGSQPDGTLIAYLRDMREEQAARFDQLSKGQGRIYSELALQGSVQQEIREAQRRACNRLARLSRSEHQAERMYADLVDELHNLVQEGSLLQPSALWRAKSKIVERLGPESFSALHGDCQNFLITAESLHAAISDVADQIDAGVITVEYAKVVETELRSRLMRALGRCMDRGAYPSTRFGRIQKRRQDWESTLSGLTLGLLCAALESVCELQRERVVRSCLADLALQAGDLRQLAKDVDAVRKLRNGAAHVSRVRREDLDELRSLLFEKGLLRKLADISQRLGPAEGYST